MEIPSLFFCHHTQISTNLPAAQLSDEPWTLKWQMRTHYINTKNRTNFAKFLRSHTLMMPSSPPERSRGSLGFHEITFTSPVWAWHVSMFALFGAALQSQMRMVSSTEQEAKTYADSRGGNKALNMPGHNVQTDWILAGHFWNLIGHS